MNGFINWLAGLKRPTFVIEGEGGNASEARVLCQTPRNPQLRCVVATGLNHFTVLPVMAAELAGKLSANPPGFEYVMHLPGQLSLK